MAHQTLNVQSVSGAKRAWAEVRVYLSHILAMFRPGTKVNVFNAYPNPVRTSAAWPAGELDALIEEGRRQLDAQTTRHDTIRDSAKVLLPTALAAAAVVAGLFGRVTARHEGWLVVIWLIAAVVLAT